MKNDERIIYFYDMVVSSRAEHANKPSMRQMLELLAAEHGAGRFRAAGDKAGHLWHFVGPISFDDANEIATVLIRASDKRSPEYGYSDTTSGALRLLSKTQHEGGDVAAHLVISLTPSEPDTYIALLEGVSGVSNRNVLSAINRLLTDFYAENPRHFLFPDPGGAKDRAGNIKEHEFKPRFKMQGHISDKLIYGIENGSIGDVELRNNSLHSIVGNDPFITSKSFRLTLSVGPGIPK